MSSPFSSRVESAVRGDASALKEILDRLDNYLGAGPKGFRSNESIEDIDQEIRLRVWRKLGEFRGKTEDDFRIWAQTVAKRMRIDAIRNAMRQKRDERRRTKMPVDSRGGALAAENVSSPSQAAVRQELLDAMAARLDSLGDDQQMVITMRLLSTKSWEEIANHFGRTEVAVKQMYYRAIAKLRSICLE